MPDDAATLAVVVARLDDLRVQQRRDTEALTATMETLRAEIAASSRSAVRMDTWETRNHHVDQRLQALGREVADTRTEHRADIAEVKKDIAARHAPWWTIGALVLSGVAIALNLIPALAR